MKEYWADPNTFNPRRFDPRVARSGTLPVDPFRWGRAYVRGPTLRYAPSESNPSPAPA